MDRYIPFHLIPEILSKLPVKSLLKFKCVSKSWLALISSPQFIKAHLNYQTSLNNQSLLVLENNCSFKYCSLNSLLYGQASPHVLIPQDEGALTTTNDRHLCRYFEIVGCSEGLICICVFRPRQSYFFLWNPSIRKYKNLPELILPSTASLSVISGFGFDASSDDYKVVVLVMNAKYSRYGTLVYSSKAGAWRRIADLPGDTSYLSSGPGVLVEGKLHFLAKETARGAYIVSLDLATEMYRELEAPNPN
nr:F-box/kelch-repeat protein At3g23880-like [Coffea arabica]